jgi:hypothetical protein
VGGGVSGQKSPIFTHFFTFFAKAGRVKLSKLTEKNVFSKIRTSGCVAFFPSHLLFHLPFCLFVVSFRSVLITAFILFHFSKFSGAYFSLSYDHPESQGRKKGPHLRPPFQSAVVG